MEKKKIYIYMCCILFLISCHLQISPPQFLHSRMSRSSVQSASSVSCKAYAYISLIEEQIKLLMLQLVTGGDGVLNLLF